MCAFVDTYIIYTWPNGVFSYIKCTVCERCEMANWRAGSGGRCERRMWVVGRQSASKTTTGKYRDPPQVDHRRLVFDRCVLVLVCVDLYLYFVNDSGGATESGRRERLVNARGDKMKIP